ncbi:hypothetical protein HY933_02895 [Candidatus Falkowbacteria bacterium]|nr:hypothetical protein [Candidatus Falkowbacteria bacterium]
MVSSAKRNKNKTAWVVAVNMGYGHQRAAQPFTAIAEGGIISVNDYPGIPGNDKRKWESSRVFYELISRSKQLPLIGEALFGWYDRKFQSIANFYPKRDLSDPGFQLKSMYRMIRAGWGKDLIDTLNKRNSRLPLLSTFFIPAFFADEHGYKGDIYCLATDTDIARQWAPFDGSKSRIKYLAPTTRAFERLKMYGVQERNLFFTGFPLPKDNIGGSTMAALKQDVWHRIHHLDPRHKFIDKYRESLVHYLGQDRNHCSDHCCLNITFAVGGAGAQRELGMTIVGSLARQLAGNRLVINLVAGARSDVYSYFNNQLKKLRLQSHLGKNIRIIFAKDKLEYFNSFNAALRTTDVLWTKPSELAFFSGLGIPIIMAEPIGAQEIFNQQWLRAVGSGIDQQDPRYAHQWLPDWIESGWLAEAALQGFLDAPKFGTYNIEQIIFKQKVRREGQVQLL